MKKIFKIISSICIFIILTILTQIGGVVFLLSEFLGHKIEQEFRLKGWVMFIGMYGLFTFIVIPIVAPLLGRERISHSERINPTNYMTVVLNRNYVRPELNLLLSKVEQNLKGSEVKISYLDANFPFIDEFPLLPHLSHNDGKKLDLSLIYETQDGIITDQQKSNSGYGTFEDPKKSEMNQILKCINAGYWQYDYPKYFKLGSINDDLQFSSKGTIQLINAILKEKELGKMFIEPHLKTRLELNDNRVRYHGCQAVRHDDHIHIQL